MFAVMNLTKRNILMYLKDRAAVFFSLLSVMIIFLLYVLFLAKMNIDSVQSMTKISRDAIVYLVNAWVMGGIIVVNSVTVTLGVLGVMVEDESQKRLPSFLVSPVKRYQLTIGYILSAFFIGIVLCIITFILSEICIVVQGGSLLTAIRALEVLGIIVASVFSSTCFVFLIVSFVKTTSVFTAVSIIIGSTIGLVAGIYVPVGVLPDAVGKFIKCLPVFYNSSLMRDIFVANPAALVFKGAPKDVVSGYLESMGVNITINGVIVSNLGKLAVVVVSGALFLLLSMLLMNRRRPAQS